MTTLPWSYRAHTAVGFFACVGLMAYALYAQYRLSLDPCPLCIFQRVAVIGTGVGFALAWVLGFKGRLRWVVFPFVVLPVLAGIAVAGRHVWLQSLPKDKVPACGPGLDFLMESYPFAEVLQRVLTGSGQCATIDWSFLGLSMPAWVLVSFVGLLGWALLGWKAR